MLLLITGSPDGTSDLICRSLGDRVFRLNYDIFNDYSLEFTPTYWRIENPAGHSISSDSVTSCFWWKAFNFPIENQDNFIVEEVKYVFRELYNWCRVRGLVKGNPFDFHNHLGKNNLTGIASRYFKVPQTLITFKCLGVCKFGDAPIVAKSLTATLTDKKGTLLTTEVDKSRLHPAYPWFLQEKIVSDYDVTVFVCDEKYFAYERSRKNLKGLDWRAEQAFSPDTKEWFEFSLSELDSCSVKHFCQEIGVEWGRLDFMRNESNELVFLEFNANGQWVFLDYDGSGGLVRTVINYLMSDV